MSDQLPYSYDLLFDIKSKPQLLIESRQLAVRLADMLETANDHGDLPDVLTNIGGETRAALDTYLKGG